MKKIALTSLLAVFAVSGAQAAAKNVLDGNPLYMPQKNHFVSETYLESHTNATNEATLGERFGYGITDRAMVAVETSFSELDAFDTASWNEVALDGAYRVIGDGAWKLDLTAGYGVDAMREYHTDFLDKGETFYTWTAGVRGGYVQKDWTLMGRLNFIYANTESFNWNEDNDDGMWKNHIMNVGFSGFWKMSDYWSGVVSADYYKVLDRYSEPDAAGYWDLSAGLNLNLDATKYVGVYVTKKVNHVAKGEWKAADGFGFGAKFGIDF